MPDQENLILPEETEGERAAAKIKAEQIAAFEEFAEELKQEAEKILPGEIEWIQTETPPSMAGDRNARRVMIMYRNGEMKALDNGTMGHMALVWALLRDYPYERLPVRFVRSEVAIATGIDDRKVPVNKIIENPGGEDTGPGPVEKPPEEGDEAPEPVNETAETVNIGPEEPTGLPDDDD